MAKYKVGDKVRCVDGGVRRDGGRGVGYKGIGYKEGLVYTVTQIKDSHHGNCYFGGLCGHGVFENYLEPAISCQKLKQLKKRLMED